MNHTFRYYLIAVLVTPLEAIVIMQTTMAVEVSFIVVTAMQIGLLIAGYQLGKRESAQ